MRYPVLLIRVPAAAGKTLSLVSGLVLGACNHLSTYISFWTCDKFGAATCSLRYAHHTSSP